MSTSENLIPFHKLAPETILHAIETIGYHCDGRISALNSYENRVYQIGLENSPPVIAKFYRPGRWPDAAILEEHSFSLELQEHEIPVICPLPDRDGRTLFSAGPFRIAIYPRVGGRAPELDDPEHLLQLGRCIGRIHNVGAVTAFNNRPAIDVASYAAEPRAYLLDKNFIPTDLLASYGSLSEQLIDMLETRFRMLDNCRLLRLHGDCHLGNILWHNDSPFIVDFDDTRTGPAMQDLWMLLSGDRHFMTARLNDLLEGYTEFRDFDPLELQLLEPLRTLRIMHFSGWLARRWDDPAFPLAFPWFNTQQYWEEHILSLREQQALLDEPPLQWQNWR
jgi:Ser/Thr protein kinase RdoA (MazF antagonist)